MVKFRAVVLGFMTVLLTMAATMASAASSASAEEFKLEAELCTGGTVIAVCWEEKNEGTDLKEVVGKEEFSLKGEKWALKVKAGEATITILCKAAENTGGLISQPEPLQKDTEIEKLTLSLTKCSVEGVKCTMREPLNLKPSKGTPENLAGELKEEWTRIKPTEGEEVTTFTLEGAECPETVKGANSVKGEYWCEWLEILIDLESHEMHCEPSESKLKFLRTDAELEALFTATLKHHALWDIESEV